MSWCFGKHRDGQNVAENNDKSVRTILKMATSKSLKKYLTNSSLKMLLPGRKQNHYEDHFGDSGAVSMFGE